MRIDFSKKETCYVDAEYQKSRYKTFYEFVRESIDYPINYAEPGRFCFTFLDKKKKIVGRRDWLENGEKAME